MLKNKKIIVGVTAGVAIYKTLELIRMLKKEGAIVQVVMTENSTKFISPQLFEVISGREVFEGLGEKLGITNYELRNDSMLHISLASEFDVFLICPATANVIGKLANGIADDFLTTLALSFGKKKIACPSMNCVMWNNKIVQENVEKLSENDWKIIYPEIGELACGIHGNGRLANLNYIYYILQKSFKNQDLKGKKILITAGPTIEKIDPVRYISNFSSGKMGYSLASEAVLRGAEVILISGKTALEKPFDIKMIEVESADEMRSAVMKNIEISDYFISSAAVCDFKVEKSSKVKMKKVLKKDLKLVQTKDILKEVGERFYQKKKRPFILGFALETENILANAKKKLIDKKCDAIFANDISNFDNDEKKGVLIFRNKKVELGKMKVSEMAEKTWNEILF